MKTVTIYTDGACSGNPGPGGWGAVLIYGETRRECCGYDPQTTNNRMELTAALSALRMLKEPCRVDLYSDSAYLINGFNEGWIYGWQMRDWKTSAKKAVENQDLWQGLLEMSRVHEITWHKVKGHADNELNNRCDQLATGMIKQHKAEGEDGLSDTKSQE